MSVTIYTGFDEPRPQVQRQPLTALAYLQAIYRNPSEPTPLRVRCAMAALAFENPRFGVVAHIDHHEFGTRMEKALARSAKLIEAKQVGGPVAKSVPSWRRL